MQLARGVSETRTKTSQGPGFHPLSELLKLRSRMNPDSGAEGSGALGQGAGVVAKGDLPPQATTSGARGFATCRMFASAGCRGPKDQEDRMLSVTSFGRSRIF